MLLSFSFYGDFTRRDHHHKTAVINSPTFRKTQLYDVPTHNLNRYMQQFSSHHTQSFVLCILFLIPHNILLCGFTFSLGFPCYHVALLLFLFWSILFSLHLLPLNRKTSNWNQVTNDMAYLYIVPVPFYQSFLSVFKFF